MQFSSIRRKNYAKSLILMCYHWKTIYYLIKKGKKSDCLSNCWKKNGKMLYTTMLLKLFYNYMNIECVKQCICIELDSKFILISLDNTTYSDLFIFF